MSAQLDVLIFHTNHTAKDSEEFVDKLKQYGVRARNINVQAVPLQKFVMSRAIMLTLGDEPIPLWDMIDLRSEVLAQISEISLSVVLFPNSPKNVSLPDYLRTAQIIDLGNDNPAFSWNRLIMNTLQITSIMETSRAIVTGGPSKVEYAPRNQSLDTIGIAAVKSRLHALSEVVAKDASEGAERASRTYPHDVLTMLIPLVVDMRWRRGYRSALERLLRLPEAKKHLRNFKCTNVDPPCRVEQGVLSADAKEDDSVMIYLDNYPAVIVTELTEQEADLVMSSVNNYGRLGRSKTGEMTVLERIQDIPLQIMPETQDDIALALYRNRDVLIPLLARFRIPGMEWLLLDDEYQAQLIHELPESIARIAPDDIEEEQVAFFEASGAFRSEHSPEITMQDLNFMMRPLNRPTRRKPE